MIFLTNCNLQLSHLQMIIFVFNHCNQLDSDLKRISYWTYKWKITFTAGLSKQTQSPFSYLKSVTLLSLLLKCHVLVQHVRNESNLDFETVDHEMCVRLFGTNSSTSNSNYALRKVSVRNSNCYGNDAAAAIMKKNLCV